MNMDTSNKSSSFQNSTASKYKYSHTVFYYYSNICLSNI